MTYMLDGTQYIVLAISGGTYTGEYVAFRLPVIARCGVSSLTNTVERIGILR